MSFTCFFEEVYKNGDTQQGILLIKNGKLRYQYNDMKLYTLIYDDNKLFMIKNDQTKKFELVEHNKEIFDYLLNIYNDYPNLKKEYSAANFKFLVEKNNDNSFIKRLAVISNKLNLSIYLKGCKNTPINNLFFKYNPLFEYHL